MLKKSSILLSSILLMLFIQGCMPVTKPFIPSGIKQDKALIYVYRPDSFIARGVTWSLLVNGEQASTYFVNNGYIPLYVDSGDTKISLTQNSLLVKTNNIYDTLVLNNLKKNKSYYVKAIPGMLYTHKLELVNNKQGEKEIKESVYYVDKK